MGGTTAASLVSYMRNHPYPGEHGDAVANIVPSYSLSIATKNAGAACKASSVDLNVRFLMTLPHATNASGMSPATRSAWTNFVSFARRHEETHRGIYLQCASGFVAKAMRLTASSCLALQSNIRSLLETGEAGLRPPAECLRSRPVPQCPSPRPVRDGEIFGPETGARGVGFRPVQCAGSAPLVGSWPAKARCSCRRGGPGRRPLSVSPALSRSR